MAVLRSTTLTKLVQQLAAAKARTLSCSYSTITNAGMHFQRDVPPKALGSQVMYQNHNLSESSGKEAEGVRRHQIGHNLSRKDKISVLVSTLLGLKDCKKEVYGALDAWIAWEQNFPIGPLKNALITLEKEQRYRRIIQVIKWMFSKGQGKTLNTYGQLIRALDMDDRVEEAHEIWVRKIGSDLHSVPWKLCNVMISVYYRNNMFQDLVKLFKGLEAFDRKPPEKSIIQKVANAYELLGMPEEKERVLDKYKDLMLDTWRDQPKKSIRTKSKKAKSGKSPNGNTNDSVKQRSVCDDLSNGMDCQ